MTHMGARRIVAFALATLTTLTTISALDGTLAVKACGRPPTFSETLSNVDAIVIGSVESLGRNAFEFGDNEIAVSIATIHVSDALKGSAKRGQSILVVNFDADDFGVSVGGEAFQAGDEGASEDRATAVPLSMKTGLFLLTETAAEGSDSPGYYYRVETFDITGDAARVGIEPLVREYVTIDAMTDRVKQRTAFLEWIVKCAENPLTRRKGFYDFSNAESEHYWRTHSEDSQDRDHVNAEIGFTDGQVDRLLDVWLEMLEERDMSLVWFGNALGERRGEIVEAKLLEAVQAGMESGDSGLEDLMRIFATISSWRSGHLLATQLSESESPEERNAIVNRFLELAPLKAEIPEALEEVSELEATNGAFEEVESEAVTELESIEREAVESVETVEREAVENAESSELEDVDSAEQSGVEAGETEGEFSISVRPINLVRLVRISPQRLNKR